MQKFDLTMSVDNVKDWSVLDALREIFQNAIDQERKNPENRMTWRHNNEVLSIGSSSSTLEKNTLLIGKSEKSDDEEAIGQFGEGYKVALLVLTRSGHDVQVLNYKAREIWTPRLVYSRKYKDFLLQVRVEKHPFWSRVPDSNLTFVIDGIHPAMLELIKERNLHLEQPTDFEDISWYGRILFDRKHAGQIFVNGLYVTTLDQLKYGYDIKPAHLKIGRDRNLVSSFDIQWVTSSMWGESARQSEAVKLISEGANDTAYIHSSRSYRRIKSTLVENFKAQHGGRAYPVMNQLEYDTIKAAYKGVKPVFVFGEYGDILKSDLSLTNVSRYRRKVELTPSEILTNFYEKYSHAMPIGMESDFSKIMEQSDDWIKA